MDDFDRLAWKVSEWRDAALGGLVCLGYEVQIDSFTFLIECEWAGSLDRGTWRRKAKFQTSFLSACCNVKVENDDSRCSACRVSAGLDFHDSFTSWEEVEGISWSTRGSRAIHRGLRHVPNRGGRREVSDLLELWTSARGLDPLTGAIVQSVGEDFVRDEIAAFKNKWPSEPKPTGSSSLMKNVTFYEETRLLRPRPVPQDGCACRGLRAHCAYSHS